MPGSFIPYHLRRGVGLPTIEEQNAMYAFYFYRLLQRSHSISFIYNSGNNGSRTGEKSRFLHQLQLESPFEIEEFGVESNIEPAPFSPIVIEKRGKVLTTLNRIIEEGHAISPTSLDQFILCPLSYYFKYIAGIKEEDELMEELDPRVFGKIFHSVMESVYKPFAGKTVDAQTLLSTIENENHLQSVLLHAFKIHFFKSEEEIKENMLAGRNKLVAEVIKKSTVQTLRNDLDKTPFVVFDLEKKVSANLQIFNNTRVVRIGGVIDRIDSLLVANEIVDYKTGISDNTFYDLASLFEENSIKRNKAAFQTMVYSWIWAEMYPETKTIFPAIYGLRNMFKLSNNRLRMKIRGDQELNFVEVKDEFEKYLRILLESIFDPSTPFRQTTAEENCLYCMYSSICRKTNG
jgi:CRISPR/Cas system-associated exonuclease Cas4 (RecB family)